MAKKYKQKINHRTGKFDLVCCDDNPNDPSDISDDYLLTDGSNLPVDHDVVSPQLSGEISATPGTAQPLKSITVEFGTVVRVGMMYKWESEAGKNNPESVSGDITELTADGDLSDIFLVENITADRTLEVNLHSPKRGFITDDKGRLINATGNQTSSAEVSITFAHKIYHGCAASFDTDDLDSLLSNSRARTLSNITTASDEYYYYAYPKTLGELTTVIQNGATPILGAFVRTEIEINNAAGTAVEYYLYTLRNIGSLTNSNSLKFE